MAQKIYTFSVSEEDKENLKLVEAIKEECKQTGRSFTYVCIQALKEYKERQNDRN